MKHAQVLKWFSDYSTVDHNRLILKDLIPCLKEVEKTITCNSVHKSSRKLPDFADIFLDKENAKHCSLLCVGQIDKINIYLNGIIDFYTIRCDELAECTVLDFLIANKFDRACLLYRNDQTQILKCKLIDFSAFVANMPDVLDFSSRLSKLLQCTQTMQRILKSIMDSWEDVFSDIGAKFANFAKETALVDPDAKIG